MNDQKMLYLTQTGITVALVGAAWSAFFNTACAVCQNAAAGIGMHYLGLLGVIFYLILTLLMLIRATRPFATFGVLPACGVHLILVTFLLRKHIACFPCFITAAGAFLAGIALLCQESFRWKKHLWALAIAFSLSLVLAIVQTRAGDKFRIAQANSLLQQIVLQQKVSMTNDGVLLIVFTRPGCHFCEQFKRDYQPVLKQHFGEKLEIEYRSAPNDLPTPSFVVVGFDTETLIGLPSMPLFERTLAQALASLSKSIHTKGVP